MKHTLQSLLAAAIIGACGIALAGHTFLDWPAPGKYQAGLGPVKIVGIDVQGDTRTNGTVIVSRVSDGATTNQLASVTCTNGVAQVALDGPWLFADDVLLRAGTATDARVRVIVQQ